MLSPKRTTDERIRGGRPTQLLHRQTEMQTTHPLVPRPARSGPDDLDAFHAARISVVGTDPSTTVINLCDDPRLDSGLAQNLRSARPPGIAPPERLSLFEPWTVMLRGRFRIGQFLSTGGRLPQQSANDRCRRWTGVLPGGRTHLCVTQGHWREHSGIE